MIGRDLDSFNILARHVALLLTSPLPFPTPPSGLSADTVATGLPVPPIDRIKLFSPREWEEFILEWGDSLRVEYERVDRAGGAGDMGRDIIAAVADGQGVWDNYQAKHYDHPLTPSDIWVELGKLVYYTFRGDYTYPRKYSFVAPQGAGTKLSNLLKDPAKLKAELCQQWAAHCRTKITSTQVIELDQPLRDYIGGLDFSIFDAIPPLRLLDAHARTRWYVARFGGGLPQRPPVPAPPAALAPAEARFVQELLLAYTDHLKSQVAALSDLSGHTSLAHHFDDARREFYSAEALRAFSRDTLPPGQFERLQDEIHAGIMDDVRSPHADGFQCVLAVVKTARFLQISHPLTGRMSTRDRGGICHQLANDGKVRWVKDGR